MKITISIILSLVVLPLGLFAEQQGHPKKKELPKSGSLSTSGSFGGGASGVDLSWGDDAIGGGAPVSGSVSRMNDKNWQMRIFNNSKSAYSVSLEVVQYDSKGSSVKRDSFSYTLRPAQKQERTVTASFNAASAELKLNSWKKLGGASKEGDAESKPSDSSTE